MEGFTLRRRNRLRTHYTLTSNVLLFGYRRLSDGAKLTYQAIDSFDWSDAAGLRKGFAHPSLARLATIRGVEKRSIRRHLADLEKVRSALGYQPQFSLERGVADYVQWLYSGGKIGAALSS